MDLKIVFCFAREDQALFEQLRKHLTPMEHIGLIAMWHEGDILPGVDVKQEIRSRLDSADILLFLVSPDFVPSKYHGMNLNEVADVKWTLLSRQEEGQF